MRAKFWKQAYPVVILTVVVAICVVLLALTDRLTRDKIAAQEGGGIKTVLAQLFPEMTRYELKNDIYTIYADGNLDGYAFLATGQGYHGEISILVGLQDENTIKGITIISQTETPGLGSQIAEPSFTGQFSGISINDVALSRDGGQIDAISGATVSSSTVVEAVRNTALEKVRQLQESGG